MPRLEDFQNGVPLNEELRQNKPWRRSRKKART
jgi:hypothetical protein